MFAARKWFRRGAALAALGGAFAVSAASFPAESVDGVTFADASSALYAPARPVADALGWPLHWDGKKQALFVNNRAITGDASIKRLPDGTTLLSMDALRYLGASVSWDGESETATVQSGSGSISIVRGGKRVEIDRSTQRLRAWQGKRLVLESPVSTGREGHGTPKGTFTAGPYKARMHYSRLYDDAPMPYSVQVSGNIFIHGFRSVPDYPASHGCIRLPLTGGNPARWFYEWVDVGTPVTIKGDWSR